MRKFIFKTLLFTLPFIALYSFTFFFYSTAESPDLLRLGYIPNIYTSYRQAFEFNKSKKFELLSKSTHRNFEIMTIGDSFSEQGVIGYKNELANDFTVLHVDRFISHNQIQTLTNLVKSDFFDKYKIKYVVLQNVERYIIDNSEEIDFNCTLNISDIDTLVAHHNGKEEVFKYDFFSAATLKFPLSSAKFFLKNNYLSNKVVYNVQLNSNSLFSNDSDKLLFYFQDIAKTEKNNLVENSENLNKILNTISEKLRQKNIKLIVLPSPDKYDLYYDYIADKKNFIKPVFFDNFRKLKKDYSYIDSKEILSEKLKTQKDIYFFDDTHWSPVSSKIIANEIKNIIKKAP